jgi:hypothetical protein
MKRLILTFFATILCYSLFFDNEPEFNAVEKINYIQNSPSIPSVYNLALDTVNYYSSYYAVDGRLAVFRP